MSITAFLNSVSPSSESLNRSVVLETPDTGCKITRTLKDGQDFSSSNRCKSQFGKLENCTTERNCEYFHVNTVSNYL